VIILLYPEIYRSWKHCVKGRLSTHLNILFQAVGNLNSFIKGEKSPIAYSFFVRFIVSPRKCQLSAEVHSFNSFSITRTFLYQQNAFETSMILTAGLKTGK